ncbi:DNAation factor subunit alpha-like [Plakobranchus ocellatus]|uniref:DNAation factor subunit alpha-like n=1 Tax=Plakobranchus ocellatus TaxID=259542 RepID=A0AAV4BLE7_9GAST|nr:DNAation factor subunit alpha-like [Plakobranchus ocellatus]
MTIRLLVDHQLPDPFLEISFVIFRSIHRVDVCVSPKLCDNVSKFASGQEKLREVENPRVVLEEDGTLVDEEDYFCTLPDDSIVQLLGEGEIWRSCKTDVPVEKTDSASSAALENQEVTVDELCRDLKEDLARIITFSTEQLQDLVDADAPSLARKLEESERFVKKLQSACQRFLDERADAMETADLVRLYDEASKANKVDKAVHTTD